MIMFPSPDRIADPANWKRVEAHAVTRPLPPAANARLVALSVGQGGVA